MTFHSFLVFLADFGDSAVLIALVTCAAFYMLWCRHISEGIALAASLLVSAGVISLLKIIMLSCGGGYMNIHSPSGHAAISISVYGTLGLVLSRYFTGWRKKLPILFFFALGLTIAVSRVITHLHSESEVFLGTLVGLFVTALVWFFLLRRDVSFPKFGKPSHFSVFGFIAILLVIAFLMHGQRLPAEIFLKKISAQIKEAVPFCH